MGAGASPSYPPPHSHKHSYTSKPSTEEVGKNSHFLASLWKGHDCILSQLMRTEGLASPVSLHVGADCDPPFWALTDLLGTTKNKEGGLESHRGLRNSQELRPG